MPRFSIGGILSNDRLSHMAARQKAMMAQPTTHDSMERLEDKLKTSPDFQKGIRATWKRLPESFS